MITKVEVKNFRNLKEFAFLVNDKATIISGQNGLGKSNLLNAICWFFTNTLLTDKWGTGENDIDTIIPINVEKGQHTEVSITFDNGVVFTKKYVCDYNRQGKITGHHTDALINDTPSKNIATWEYDLHQQIKFNRKIRSINELRLITDPLYALQKVKPQELRALLIELGCSVTNQEIFELGFQDLEQYEAKYRGDYSDMRRVLKGQLKKLGEDVKAAEILLSSVAGYGEFDSTELDRLEAEKVDLINKKNVLKNADIDLQVKEFDIQIEMAKKEREMALNKHISDIDNQISHLKLQLDLENSQLAIQKDLATKELKSNKAIYDNELKNIDSKLRNYQTAADNLRLSLRSIVDTAKSNQELKQELAIQYQEEAARTYTDYITCPNCQASFAADTEALERFNQTKASNLEALNNRIAKLNDDNIKKKADADALKLRIENSKIEIEKLHHEQIVKMKELVAIKDEIAKYENASQDLTKVNELELEIKALENQKLVVPAGLAKYDMHITTLENQKKSLIDENYDSINEQLVSIDRAIEALKEPINEQYALKSKAADNAEYKKQLEVKQANFNDLENLLLRVSQFIYKQIELVNQKARMLTGIDFVMLEENLKDEGVKEVCYATFNGVPFSEVNTSEKITIGVKFIENVKRIIAKNFEQVVTELPILADRCEGFDFTEKINALANDSQVICTRVSTENEITIL